MARAYGASVGEKKCCRDLVGKHEAMGQFGRKRCRLENNI
jgi:hypothetical protein